MLSMLRKKRQSKIQATFKSLFFLKASKNSPKLETWYGSAKPKNWNVTRYKGKSATTVNNVTSIINLVANDEQRFWKNCSKFVFWLNDFFLNGIRQEQNKKEEKRSFLLTAETEKKFHWSKWQLLIHSAIFFGLTL